MEIKQLSLAERWQMDMEGMKKGMHVPVKSQQCFDCLHQIKGNARNCRKYTTEKKPGYVCFPEKECPYFEASRKLLLKAENKEQEKLLGGLLGLITADALGVPAEFCEREERKKDPVCEMRGYGTYHMHFGTWSDDSSLMLCLVECINRGFSTKLLAELILKYAYEGYMTPYGEVFDIGTATRKAAERIYAGAKPADCGGRTEYDNGNGSLMRILPMAWYTRYKPVSEKIRLIEEVSSVTHAHPCSLFACIFYIEMVQQLLNGETPVSAYAHAIAFVKNHLDDTYAPELDRYRRLLDGKIMLCGEEDIRSTGFVLDSLEASVWAFLTTEHYKDAVLKCINLGGDTDTIAAICGGLAGVYYGMEDIPVNWRDMLANKPLIEQVLKQSLTSLLS